ncbi:hypothetical protein N7523_001258 [Penicillium sp. IBT 18751x]|nr:hypothetical protein N7523_001258 [Penicillium sp. IBT 18751x]
MNTASQKVEKRNRPPVSCEPCRTRKLKCNREQPCDSCFKRKRQSTCHYAANAERNKPKASNHASLNDRLKGIEELVSSLISTGNVAQMSSLSRDNQESRSSHLAPETPPLSIVNTRFTPKGVASGPGKEIPRFLHDQNGESVYVEPSHWMSILQDIKEMRADLSYQDSLASNELASSQDLGLQPDISLGFALRDTLSISDIFNTLPSQSICDVLLSQYFNSRYMVLGIVHSGKFRTEYGRFWKDPKSASFGWLALLFSILAMSTILRKKSQVRTETNQSMPSTEFLQQMTAQCLVSSGYATAKENALEALLLYIQSRFMTQTSSSAQLWLELGTIIRLALRMGYHRDPNEMTNVPKFEGEMRRRVWLHIFQIDALTSFQMGLPSMIPTEYCDTQVPRNLYDTDLCIGMDDLPPSRPHEEATPILYAIVKSGIMRVFKKIVASTQSLATPGYEDLLALDYEMKEVYGKIPSIFLRRDISESFMDSSDMILERCSLELLYLKGIVVLHRRYIRYEPQNPAYDPSRRFCLEAALEILARQADIYRAILPGGRLHEDRWMVTALTVHDFLLAAMVVCLDLSVRMQTLQQGDRDFALKKLRALQISQQIWAANGDFPSQSHLASLTLDLMIQKINAVQFNPDDSHMSPNSEQNDISGIELPYMEAMSDMIDGTEALDWINSSKIRD